MTNINITYKSCISCGMCSDMEDRTLAEDQLMFPILTFIFTKQIRKKSQI